MTVTPSMERVLDGIDGSRRVAWAKYYELCEISAHVTDAISRALVRLSRGQWETADDALRFAITTLDSRLPERIVYRTDPTVTDDLIADFVGAHPGHCLWVDRLSDAIQVEEDRQDRAPQEDAERLAEIVRELANRQPTSFPDPISAIDRVLAWCDHQDQLSKGESPTTAAVRAAIEGTS